VSVSETSSGPPWYGVDDALLRRFEIHETHVHARGAGRRVIDLGDALGLFDSVDPDPFYNRVGAIRWPADPVAFDARVDAALELFQAERRDPCLWLSPVAGSGGALVDRLTARGFIEVGHGALVMVLTRDPRAEPGTLLAPGTSLERLTAAVPDGGVADARAAAAIVAESFGVDRGRRAVLEDEILAGLADPSVDMRLVRLDGEPVAVGRRHDRDDLGYLSAIGVSAAYQGRGFGEAVTRALVCAALDGGRRWVYLGVYSDNRRAQALYERIGFATLAGPALELVLP